MKKKDWKKFEIFLKFKMFLKKEKKTIVLKEKYDASKFTEHLLYLPFIVTGFSVRAALFVFSAIAKRFLFDSGTLAGKHIIVSVEMHMPIPVIKNPKYHADILWKKSKRFMAKKNHNIYEKKIFFSNYFSNHNKNS